MGLHIKPRSIRGKLLVVFIIAIAPVLCVQVCDNVSNYLETQHTASKNQYAVASASAESVAVNINRLKNQQQIWARKLVAGNSTPESIKLICKKMDAAMGGYTHTYFAATPSTSMPLKPGYISKPSILDIPIKGNQSNIALASQVKYKNGKSGKLVTIIDSRNLSSCIPDAATYPGWHLFALLNNQGNVIVSKQRKHGIVPRNLPLSDFKLYSKHNHISISSCPICGTASTYSRVGVPGTDWSLLAVEQASSILAETRQRHKWFILCALATALGVIIVLAMGNRLAHPIRRLALAANALAVGDYRKRVSMNTRDELETLGNSFNSLGESLLSHESTMREQAEMLTAMVEAARVASSTLDICECGKAIAEVVCTHLGASDAAVYRKNAEDGGIKIIGRYGERLGSAWKRLAVRAASSGDYLTISERQVKADKSDLNNDAILVGIPLTAGTNSIGSMVVRFDSSYNKDDLRLGSIRADVLMAFGVHAAAAIANAEVHSQTEQYSEVLADWVEHLSSVMQVTSAISPSLNLDETLKALACATQSVLDTDECVIYLPDRNGDLTVRSCCSAEQDIILQVRIKPGESESGVAFTGKRYIALYDASKSTYLKTQKLSEVTGMNSLLSAPLLVDDRAIGVITVYSKELRQFTAKEIQLLTSIGLHAAVIVRNASLYTRESSIAETLQKGLLPEAPEEYRGLRFASRYTPALDEARVGGDFFDVIPLPNGHVGVVMADVSGKGLSAAIHLATCKYMLKGLMYAHPDDPAKVLCELNDAINSHFDASFFVTLFCCVVDPNHGTLHYANAGHPPALLLAEEGKIHTCLPSTGIPVGSGYDCQYGAHWIDVKPSDILILYTDGVTDAVKDDKMLGVDGLHAMIFEAGQCSAAAMIDYIYDELSRNQAAFQRDDIALLAVSFEDLAAASDTTTGGQDEDSCCLRLQAI